MASVHFPDGRSGHPLAGRTLRLAFSFLVSWAGGAVFALAQADSLGYEAGQPRVGRTLPTTAASTGAPPTLLSGPTRFAMAGASRPGYGPRHRAGRLELELQVLRRQGWRRLSRGASDHRLQLGWREPALRALLRRPGRARLPPVFCRLRLLGEDHGWVDVGPGGWRIYTPLRHGRHVLQLAAASPGSRFACPAASWELRVACPPWLRWWAWSLYLAAGMVCGWAAMLAGRRLPAAACSTGLLAELGHELRAPVAGMLGMLDMLGSTATTRRQQRCIQRMRQSGGSLLALIDRHLQITGRHEVAFAPESMCRTLLQWLRPMATARGLVLRFELLGRLPASVSGDRVRIEQVLLNTLGNAIKYSECGEVGLATCWQQGVWRLWIHDSGPGIPWWQRHRVFRRAIRLPSARRIEGRGLGLAISRRWVRRMGGQISLHAATEHGALPAVLRRRRTVSGTVVKIRLPLPEGAAVTGRRHQKASARAYMSCLARLRPRAWYWRQRCRDPSRSEGSAAITSSTR